MDSMNIAILGATGSIGRQTLDIVRAFPDSFHVVGLAAGKSKARLAELIDEFQPRFVSCLGQPPQTTYGEYRFLPPDEIARHPEVDTVVIATSGSSGLMPTLTAAGAGKRIALANKESLVAAGEIITEAARSGGAQILPVDSEHSALWQCLRGETQPVSRLILTASGGPFYRYPPEELDTVTVEEALGHPTWQMGKKVTVDSATLMNKGLEVIEAHWLFHTPYDNIEILIHPASIVHSLVEFIDGSVKAQLSYPDMRLPIQYALTYPERLANDSLPRLDWGTINCLTFDKPDYDKFPCLKLAVEAGRRGGTYPAVLSTADEAAVALFLSRQIKFTDIAHLVERSLAEHQAIAHPTLEEIQVAQAWVRKYVRQIAPGANR